MPDIPAREEVLEEAFALSRGDVGDLVELPDGTYYAVRVDDVIPAALRPLDEVRDAVAEAWRAELTDFYTRVLARPWTGDAHATGERFLADCRAPLDRGEAVDAAPIPALDLAARG